MKSPGTADAAYLRRILFVLIVSTTATGGIATYTAVKVKQVRQPDFALAVPYERSTPVKLDLWLKNPSRDAGFDNFSTRLISANLRD